MFRDLSQLARSKQPPGELRHFGSADNPAFLREVLKNSWIPSRKDKVPKKELKAKSPPAPDVQKVQKDVVITVIPEPEPAVEAPPEPQRAPPAPMSRSAMGKAMKVARKTARAKTARPMMRSSGQLPKLNRRTDAAKLGKKPKAPPFELNDDAIREAAQKALNRFTQRKVLHALATMATMLDPYAQEEEHERILITHAIGVVQEEIAEARSKKIEVDRRFLHAKSARAFGKLVGLAWHRLKAADPYNSRRRRFDVFCYDQEGIALYFIVEPTKRLQAIHIAMGPKRFKQWICGVDCCENPRTRRSRRRIET